MSELDHIETKLSAARTRLILDRPFLGALVLRMPMKAADPRWCKTIGTDARAFDEAVADVEVDLLEAPQPRPLTTPEPALPRARQMRSTSSNSV